MCQVLIHICLQTSRTIFKLEFLSIPSWTLLQPKISEIKSEKYFFQPNLAIMCITGFGDKVTRLLKHTYHKHSWFDLWVWAFILSIFLLPINIPNIMFHHLSYMNNKREYVLGMTWFSCHEPCSMNTQKDDTSKALSASISRWQGFNKVWQTAEVSHI